MLQWAMCVGVTMVGLLITSDKRKRAIMKKQYVKPVCVIENFRIDTSIASGCGYDDIVESLLSGYLQLNPTATVEELIDYLNSQGIGEFCYHTSQGTNIFNS